MLSGWWVCCHVEGTARRCVPEPGVPPAQAVRESPDLPPRGSAGGGVGFSVRGRSASDSLQEACRSGLSRRPRGQRARTSSA